MKITNIDLKEKSLNENKNIVDECNKIIEENLAINGVTLKKSDIFEKDFDWTNLIIASNVDEIIGFLLVRLSNNMHNLKDSESYYYISDIVVKEKYRRQGVGTSLFKELLALKENIPLVASVLNNNQPSLSLTSKFMTCYGKSPSGKYYRFVDNESYNKLYGNMINNDNENELSSSGRHI